MIKRIAFINKISDFNDIKFCGNTKKTTQPKNLQSDTFVKEVKNSEMENINLGIEHTIHFLRKWSEYHQADRKIQEGYKKCLETLKSEDPTEYQRIKDFEAIPYNTSFKLLDMKTSRDPIKIIKELIIRTPDDPSNIKGNYQMFFDRNGEILDDYLEVN